jgi:hypothetical protein
MGRLLSIAAVVLLGLLAGCQVDQQYSQTELSALQTREFDAPFDATFDAVINAVFDAGYTVRSSDKRAGFLSASRASFDAWRGYMPAVVQIKVEAAGPRTSVRISTTDGGQQRVNKKQLDEMFTLISRRLVSGSTPGARP